MRAGGRSVSFAPTRPVDSKPTTSITGSSDRMMSRTTYKGRERQSDSEGQYRLGAHLSPVGENLTSLPPPRSARVDGGRSRLARRQQWSGLPTFANLVANAQVAPIPDARRGWWALITRRL